MAPINAASSRNETASNGSTKSRKIAPPIVGRVTGERAERLGVLHPERVLDQEHEAHEDAEPDHDADPALLVVERSRPIGAFVSIRPNRNRITMAPT